MRFFAHYLLSALLLVMSCVVSANYEPPLSSQKLILDRQGIKIWSYQVPNSPLYGFRAVTTVKSTLSGLVSLIADTQNGSRWLYRTSHIDLLQRNDADMSFTVRVVTDFPWPFNDREALVFGRISQDPQSYQVRIDSHNVDTFPVDRCCLRMPSVEGSWIFKPLADGQVEVTMTGHADPGGRVPVSVVNLLIQEHPYNSLKGLRRIIGESRYQNGHFLTIREPNTH